MKKAILPILCIFAFYFNGLSQTTYKNPVIPGFYPDPSVCRVGEDYYLVNSSFGYFPGVPVFHSKDLINWEQTGYVLTRKSQLPLDKSRISTGGIFAPSIRYHNGLFYMVTTNISILKNFYVTAKNPAGPWSDPIWIDLPPNLLVIDPSFFFDDDGKVYLTTSPGFTGNDGILLSQIDISNGKLLSQPKSIWPGTGGRYPEGPHIYKKDGWYYLMIAEGGTEYGHKVTIARSKKIDGPYTSDPANPILTHINRNAQSNPIQGTGHADMVQAADGSWWMVALAFRPVANHHNLGRETFLVPVKWEKNEWPVVNDNGTINLEMNAKTLPLHPYPISPSIDNFNGSELGFQWNYINNPKKANYSLTDRKGYLRLRGDSATLNELGAPSFTGRRQQHQNFTATTLVEFDPANENEEAGLTVLMDTQYHYDLLIKNDAGKRKLVLFYKLGLLSHIEKEVTLENGPVELQVKGSPAAYQFLYKQGDHPFAEMGKVNASFLSSESVGGFTGVYIGMYASGNGRLSKADAFFDWFDYTAD